MLRHPQPTTKVIHVVAGNVAAPSSYCFRAELTMPERHQRRQVLFCFPPLELVFLSLFRYVFRSSDLDAEASTSRMLRSLLRMGWLFKRYRTANSRELHSDRIHADALVFPVVPRRSQLKKSPVLQVLSSETRKLRRFASMTS